MNKFILAFFVFFALSYLSFRIGEKSDFMEVGKENKSMKVKIEELEGTLKEERTLHNSHVQSIRKSLIEKVPEKEQIIEEIFATVPSPTTKPAK